MRRITWTSLASYVLLTTLVALELAPLLILLIMSFKSQMQFVVSPLVPTFPLHLDNYVKAWEKVRQYMLNSVTVTVTVLAGNMVLSSLAAYVFARYRFPGRNIFFSAILALMMIPGVTILIPRFVLVRDLHLLNSLWAVVLPGIFGASAFNIFVLRTFFESLPEEIFESARLDGAGHASIFARIVVPLSWPILSSLAILEVLGTWNDYIWPLMVLNRDHLRTIAVGLVFFSDQYNPQIGVQMAGNVIASIPLFILFFVAMRTFIQGLTSGALKM